MKINLKLLVLAIIISSCQVMKGQPAGNAATDVMLKAFSPRSFTSEAVTDQQLDLILKCGIKAPSSRNNQPWKFTVVRDEATMKDLIGNVLPGNVLILVSGQEAEGGKTPDFDCGLATQNMFLAATSLGLGARIYGGPAGAANAKREMLQVPTGYKIVVILRIGNIDRNIDAVSAASTRKTQEEVVNFRR